MFAPPGATSFRKRDPMTRFLRTALVSVALAATASAPALASGSGGGGGGGGSTTSAACGNLTVGVTISTAGGWQIGGKTSTVCDGLPVAISFNDSTPQADCTVNAATFMGATYFKYGVRPPSRYASTVYLSGNSCSGSSHTIDATLSDRNTGAVLSTASTTWLIP